MKKSTDQRSFLCDLPTVVDTLSAILSLWTADKTDSQNNSIIAGVAGVPPLSLLSPLSICKISDLSSSVATEPTLWNRTAFALEFEFSETEHCLENGVEQPP